MVRDSLFFFLSMDFFVNLSAELQAEYLCVANGGYILAKAVA